MSRNEFERINLTLPSAEVAALKKVLREKTTEVHLAVKAEAVRLHKSFGTRSIKLYAERLYQAQRAMWTEREAIEDRHSGWGLMMVGTSNGGFRDPYAGQKALRDQAIAPHIITSLAFDVLERVILRDARPSEWEKREPTPIHQPTTADVARVVPKLTNRDTEFGLINADGVITIKGRAVYYGSGDGNHSAEYARDSILGKIFFGHLSGITWTQGTGGVGMGNDEYNRESDYVGGGGNYITETWGPLGEKARENQLKGYWVG